MITWKEYLIMQFLNTVTFLIIQEFFWLKMKNRFDNVLGAGKISFGKEHIQKVHHHLKRWKEKQREGLLSGYKK
ncbi:hypothetical protein HZA99_02615 [Candidatus Woesearchaeota archaeon]|nr:hypothetical protein [Candidatus Woesearchaeota archaeon]